jgi:glyoxylase-like metal-dependent hydrolase (beta-lactamase superfamily II)
MKRLACLFGLLTFAVACGEGGLFGSDSSAIVDDAPPPCADDAGPVDTADAGPAVDGSAADASAEPEPAFPDPTYWENGTSCGNKPDLQVYKYSKNSYLLRQSVCTNFEAPFHWLLFGKTRALLLDTGTGHVNLRGAVDTAISEYVAANGITGPYPLFVAHTHSHGDHVLGDQQLKNRPDTTIVGYRPAEVALAFNITDWPNGQAEFDLGERKLDVLAFPGHESAHIAIYDRNEQLLMTGDTLYPGRLYIQNWPLFQGSIHRLAEWIRNNKVPVRYVVGNHIEMSTTPGQDYPFGTTTHPDEHRLELTIDQLYELETATQAMGATPRREKHDHFIIFP